MEKFSINHSSTNIGPIQNMGVNKIAENFSKKALAYDQFTEAQKFAAQSLYELIEKHVNTTPTTILEIGCGTGCLSGYLVDRFPTSSIDFIDPAAEMIALCIKKIKDHLNLNATPRNYNFIQKSIEEYLKDKIIQKKYSLIVSSFALHWVNDLPSVINVLVHNLEKEGQLFFSYPTNKSFPEWRAVCQQINLPFTRNKLPDLEELHQFIKGNEATQMWHEYTYKLTFADALEFFREIKSIGAHSILLENPENSLSNRQLTFKEFRQMIKTWNQMCISPNGYEQTVNCTYSMVEGIITHHN